MENLQWKDAVIQALRRYSERHHTHVVTRSTLIEEELDHIIDATDSKGLTPGQTLSRILQELREAGILYFLGEGNYLLLDMPVDVEQEDLPDEAIDFAVKRNKLRLGQVPADDHATIARRRRGQARISRLTRCNYRHRCALCDISERRLLVASHISRWADDPPNRGNLANVICLCRLHDPLFEQGYFALTDDYQVLQKVGVRSQMLITILAMTKEFRLPRAHYPSAEFLRQHRIRTGFEPN